jgi:AraC-like DNA-binding protein
LRDVLTEQVQTVVAALAAAAIQPIADNEAISRSRLLADRKLAAAVATPANLALDAATDLTFGLPFASQSASPGQDDVQQFIRRHWGGEPCASLCRRRVRRSAGEQGYSRCVQALARHNARGSAKPTTVPPWILDDHPSTAAQQASITMAWRGVSPHDRRYPTLLVMSAILGGGLSNRIGANIRDRHGWAHAPLARVVTVRGASVWVESTDVQASVAGNTITDVLAEVGRLRIEPPTDSEVEGVKRFLLGTFAIRNSQRALLPASLSFARRNNLRTNYLQEYTAQIRAVQPADVQALARAIFALDDAARAVGASKRTLARRMRQVLGRSPLAYFQSLRVERAVQFLKTTNASVDQVAARVGYADGATLRALLRRRLNLGVKDIRRSP